MSDPKPTPLPRDRKARRKLSPGQVAYLKSKSEKEKQKAKREEKMRLDGWYLHNFYPEIAKAKRKEGWENGIKKWAERRYRFIEIVADWPAVMSPEKMRIECKGYLARERSKPWRDAPRHYLDKPESVQKKIYELGLYRYNPRLGLYFKCGSVEEAEAAQRLAERAEEDKRRAHLGAHQKEQQEVMRKKAEAEQAERGRLSRPAVAGWHDFIPEELKPTALAYFTRNRRLAVGEGLDDLPTSEAEKFLRQDRAFLLGWLKDLHDAPMRRLAEAVLVAD